MTVRFVRCKRHHLKQRCLERCVALDDAWASVVEEDEDSILVDISHPAYPRPWCGPGCQLTRTLAWFGAAASERCKCKEHARQMDAWGPDGCLERIPEILGWLESAARESGVSFHRQAVELLVRIAIEAGRKPAA